MTSSLRQAATLAIAASFAGLGAARAATLEVPSEYGTMNAALDSAAFGDTVLVAPGVYTEYETRATGGFGLVTAMAFVPDGVVLRSEGGVAVTELRHGASGTTSARAIWIENAASGQTEVEGFRITTSLASRGGIGVRVSSVTVRDCEFDGLDLRGIDLWLSDAVVEDCSASNCQGQFGGGGVGSNDGTIFITRCTFRNCAPGGVSLTGGHDASVADYAEVRDCLFDGNSSGAGGGGGLRIAKYQTGSIVNQCVFIGNTSTGFGGAIVMSATSTGGVTVSDCVFSGNQGDTFGGAVTVGPSGIVVGNTFYDNTWGTRSTTTR
jgi:predicted outer membrane repeat protein